jgi:hypothetical protein
MSLNHELAAKSVQAAIAAIAVYNKPSFSYREEVFSLLMANAWELLLKAKWLVDHNDALESLYEYETGPAGSKIPRRNRSGNPVTIGVTYLIGKLLEDKHAGFERGCHDNILALLEIRDNAAHLVNKEPYLGRRIFEIGTASLQNYLQLVQAWFQFDLSHYNFFLMPLSFYHGFEVARPVSLTKYPEQVQRLLAYLDCLESDMEEYEGRQHVALRLETKLVRGKDAAAIEFQWTDDPSAPALTLREEDVFKNYPWTYRDLTARMRKRYENFAVNQEFTNMRRMLEKEKRFAYTRVLHPDNPKSQKKTFYSANILQEFDKLYRSTVFWTPSDLK